MNDGQEKQTSRREFLRETIRKVINVGPSGYGPLQESTHCVM